MGLQHSNVPREHMHDPYRWVFADSNARIQATPVAEDVFKWAWQESDNTQWVLTAVGPIVWQQVANQNAINDLSGITDISAARAKLELLSAALRDVGADSDDQIPDKGLLRTEYGLRKQMSVDPTLSFKFTKNEYKLYEQYGLEPKTILQALNTERGSTGTYVDAIGKIRTAGIDEPRITFDPETGENLGLLVERESTNLWLHSEDFTQSWGTIRMVIHPNIAISPDGTMNASKLAADTESGPIYLRQTASFAEGQKYYASWFLKEAEHRYVNISYRDELFDTIYAAVIDLRTGEILVEPSDLGGNITDKVALDVEIFPNGWIRAVASGVADKTTTTSNNFWVRLTQDSTDLTPEFVGDDTSGILIWGAQLEQSPTVSSYIPTTDSQMTRADDDVQRLNAGELSQRGFSGVFEFTLTESNPPAYFYTIGTSSNADGLQFRQSSVGRIHFSYRVGGVGTSDTTLLNGTFGSTYKIAFAIEDGRQVFAIDGEVLAELAELGVPIVDGVSLGSRFGVARASLTVKQSVLTPEIWSNSEVLERSI